MSENPEKRRSFVKQHKRCFNCLSTKHIVTACRSKFSCRKCNKRHHTMLHYDSNSHSGPSTTAVPGSSSSQNTESTTEVKSLFASATLKNRPSVLLATATVTVGTIQGRTAVVRALLDQGSEMIFISESLSQALRAQRIRMPVSISAVGGIHAGTYQYATRILISPQEKLYPSLEATALILKTLTSYTPKRSTNLTMLDCFAGLPLADPNPSNPDPIDLIIGADLYNDIILDGIRRGKPGQPIAQNSIFGWVISGPINAPVVNSFMSSASVDPGASVSPNLRDNHISEINSHHCLSSLENEISKFWEVEEIPYTKRFTPQEEQCERHFETTYSRNRDGRYVVRLPFKAGPPIEIGKSKALAEKVLNSLERKFKKNSALETEYNDFLLEYEQLGHMRISPKNQGHEEQYVYIPHHAVIRDSSSTTRLRVVFNASSVTSNSTSLNDHLWAGPKLQKDITSVISIWRRHKYVYSADIAKMYRQILVNSNDLNYQRILWKNPKRGKIEDYQLLTVTYGMCCAPFLALRVLEQLVKNEGKNYPRAVPILKNNIYVDDVLFGRDDPQIVGQIRDELIALLRCGGFELRKWASNSSALLADVDGADHGLACNRLLDTDERVKILGVEWNPVNDVFEFQVSLSDPIPKSKRSILSAIARLYDPLGWVTPVTISTKIFMQQLWREKLQWDEELHGTLNSQWRSIYSQLSHLNGTRISRWIGLGCETKYAELHGFSDASNRAYASVVYIKVVAQSGTVTVALLAGKSRVAPLKTISIPRLELCAALLLAKLVSFIRESLSLESIPCYCWTDSTIVLAWISQHPSRWKPFVANRITEIQMLTPRVAWRHVPTESNPADCASRGLRGDEIINHKLWWHGPDWLRFESSEWPCEDLNSTVETSLEQKTVSLQCSPSTTKCDLESRYSSWPKLIRITAYLFRFARLCRSVNTNSQSSLSGVVVLSAAECGHAKQFWIKTIQAQLFPDEIDTLAQKRHLSSKSSILCLNPFLDENGVLRVGGRLRKAPLSFSFRYPILLSSHPLVNLIVKQAHSRALHAGPQLTLNILRREFWILRSRSIIKAVIHRCVVCARERATIPTQIMGDLPEQRVSRSSRSFLHCGIDYAGPVHVRASPDRGITSRKAYIALFIWLPKRYTWNLSEIILPLHS